ncbi:hypothetical protein K435DRAFT_870179 [Dendrothele bispora CBS 962.96]|uniref:Uncharacterized protein n=1 Tax=Dendrothele bispora (strain CBS 962.96) TaxID=1314807 RepID=A0A4S8L8L0_DENBC|nr:hypothetical protein K435DRAFT_870179 [Dendrothele bispora CBS 962.96]
MAAEQSPNTSSKSSTTGVQIALSGFINVSYDTDSQTTTFGTQIYAYLQQFNVSVVRGRVFGVDEFLSFSSFYNP